MKTVAKHTLIVIAGPTAVGKTRLAISLAKKLETEIISADSRQFFRELNIGTAKPSAAELAEVRHHFINSLSISQDYDAAQFASDALQVLNEIFKHHKVAIVCGGSGLYIKALCEGFDDIPEIPFQLRSQIAYEYAEKGIAWLQQRVGELDPDYYEVVDRKNPHRLIRALEVSMSSGMPYSSFRRKKKTEHGFGILKVGLDLPREELYNRIDQRMDQMISAGLFEEAKGLIEFRHHQALQTVGYTEIFDYLDGKYDRDECIRLLKRNSRRYAKRQLTWFRRDASMKWFHPEDESGVMEYVRSEVGSLMDKV